MPARVTIHDDLVNRMARQAAEQVVRITMVKLIAEVKRLMRDHKTGRIYIRPGGRQHQASAPGEAPAIDFMTLIGAIDWEMHDLPTGVVGVAGIRADAPNGPNGANPLDYALYLEFGTSKMAPRPCWRPAFDTAIAFARARLMDSQVKVGVQAAALTTAAGEFEMVFSDEAFA